MTKKNFDEMLNDAFEQLVEDDVQAYVLATVRPDEFPAQFAYDRDTLEGDETIGALGALILLFSETYGFPPEAVFEAAMQKVNNSDRSPLYHEPDSWEDTQGEWR